MQRSTAQEHGLLELAPKHHVRLILLFGSAAGGPMHAHSDLDIAVRLEDGEIPLRKRAEIALDLQEIFPHQRVDLSVINRADPLFLKKNHGKLPALVRRRQGTERTENLRL